MERSGWPREYRPYPNAQGQYIREIWDGSGPRHPDPQANWQMAPGYNAEGYPPHGVPKIPPYGRQYMPAKTMPPHPGQQHQYVGQANARKEISFPPHSVEAVSPVLMKRRRLTPRDVSPIEGWRLMMALKSGLLAESTWALDTISVLLFDDNSILYFGLNHMPGFLETLMEHYRRCLFHVFQLTEDLEIGYNYETSMGSNKNALTPKEKKWFETDRDVEARSTEDETPIPLNIDPSDKLALLEVAQNYTKRSRCGKAVRLRQDESLFLMDPDKKWDTHEGFNGSAEHWQMGGGETTAHIQTHLEPFETNLRFVRVMEDKKGSDKVEESDTFSKPLKESSIKVEKLNCIKEPSIEKQSFTSCNQETIIEPINDKGGTNCDEKPNKDELELVTYPRIRPSACKRKASDDDEEESYNRDEPSLYLVTDAQNSLACRCVCISTILRNLSFVPGNDVEMTKHAGFLLVLGRLILLHHKHSVRKPSQRHYDKEEDGTGDSWSTGGVADSCSSLNGEKEWWWDTLHIIRENSLVTLANIACQLDLSPFPEEISLPILDGLLHWATCPSSYAQDPLPSLPAHSVLSPQRLSIETLCKLSILDNNIDLLLATPPWSRIEQLFAYLTKSMSRNEDQVLREFSVVLLSNLARADSSSARAIAMQSACIPQLIMFVEQAEQSAFQVANAQGINALRDNPELMGTTLDMVRRAAGTLRYLSKVPDNKPLFFQHQQRLLTLVMSQILDQGVAQIMADVLYECSQQDSGDGTS